MKNETTADQKLWDVTKIILKGNFITRKSTFLK